MNTPHIDDWTKVTESNMKWKYFDSNMVQKLALTNACTTFLHIFKKKKETYSLFFI